MTAAPPQRPFRAGFWVGLLAVLAIAAGAYLALRPSVPEQPEPAGSSPDGVAGNQGLAPRVPKPAAPRELLLAGDWVPPAKLDVRSKLKSRLSVVRIEAMREIVAARAIDKDLAPELEALRGGADAAETLWIKAALMTVEGSRRFLKEMATLAAEHPKWDLPGEFVRRVDPAAGSALLAAVAEAKSRADLRDRGPVEGLDAWIDRLIADPAAASSSVAEAMSRATVADAPVWVTLASALRPLPKNVVSAWVERARSGGPTEKATLASRLSKGDLDLSAASDDLRALVSDRIADKDDPSLWMWVRAASALPRIDEVLIERLLAHARRGPGEAYQTYATITALGRKAKGAGPGLVALAASSPEGDRRVLDEALLATESPEAIPYAAARLETAPAAERSALVDRLVAVADPAPLVAPLARLVGGADAELSAKAVRALARIDPVGSAVSSSLVAALADARPSVRLAAAKAVSALAAPAASFAPALAKAMEDADPAVRLAATEAVAGLHRLGEAGKPFLASVLRVLAPETGAGSDVVARAVRTAASIDAQDPAVRTACAKALDDPSPDVRYAAAWGILKARNATAAERDAVRKRADDPRIKALLDAVEAPKPGG